ncbi:TerD domain protein (plasmid) [Duffyella gerundensis]|jgi:tellurite resistance protein TerA|uniref:TerD family protein n=1 Tax=Duffyella gerundensis TaxID=1619313 RepID=UPI001CE293F7|nr:TerD family protein [Duffyella gerundensis]UCB32993.1 TerD domain protein [Duffyella gerundensis]
MNLTPGGNAPIPTQSLIIRVSAGAPVDASSFRLYDNGKVRGDSDMVFYGQRENDDKTIRYSASGNETMFTVNLPQLKQDVQKVAFTATCDAGKTIGGLGTLTIQVEAGGTVLLSCPLEVNGRQEAALILGEIYRRNDEWKFRFVAQGFNGGLQPLAEHLGIDIADDPTPAPAAAQAAPAPAPAAEKKVNLSKVSLTKEKPAISLQKKEDYGQIRVNLNWNKAQAPAKTKGFLGGVFGGGNKGIDLDLAAYVELNNGQRTIVQALGSHFGSMNSEPFVELQGDDRTGAKSDGEWLHINGRQWRDIREVLIFAFIYQGAPSWENTDGVVTINMPDQPPIETFLTEGNNRQNMCAIARLVNDAGSIRVERINRYFSGHKELDEAFGWGFNWKAGSK